MTPIEVLVVDDNLDNLDFITEVLEDSPYHVRRAWSGPDALSLLCSESIDVVLLDLMMPDMNGFAVLELIRFMPQLCNVPVIVLTAYNDTSNQQRARQLGAQAVLAKPVDRGILKNTIDQVAGRTAAQAEAV